MEIFEPLREVIEELLPKDDEILTMEDVENIKGYGSYVDEIVDDSNNVNSTIAANGELLDEIVKGEQEVLSKGILTKETANNILVKYNILASALGESETFNTESALAFRNELLYLTKENSDNKGYRLCGTPC